MRERPPLCSGETRRRRLDGPRTRGAAVVAASRTSGTLSDLVFGSLTLGRVFGVTVRVHGLVLVLLGVLLVSGAVRGQPVVLPLGTLVVALLAHELGHAVVARRLGVQVLDVVLWPLGGMARMAEVPEDAGVEARIAVAGPLVNLALASVTFAGLSVFGAADLAALGHGETWRHPASAAQAFLLMNLLLGLGNLVPAFPMDGGRLLRAGLVASGRTWLTATEAAVRVGRWLAVAMIVLGFLYGFALTLVGLFVLLMGARERIAVRLRHAFSAAGRGDTRPGPRPDGPDLGSWPFAAPPPSAPEAPRHPGGGFSAEDVARLERFRGRLRRGLEDS